MYSNTKPIPENYFTVQYHALSRPSLYETDILTKQIKYHFYFKLGQKMKKSVWAIKNTIKNISPHKSHVFYNIKDFKMIPNAYNAHWASFFFDKK